MKLSTIIKITMYLTRSFTGSVRTIECMSCIRVRVLPFVKRLIILKRSSVGFWLMIMFTSCMNGTKIQLVKVSDSCVLSRNHLRVSVSVVLVTTVVIEPEVISVTSREKLLRVSDLLGSLAHAVQIDH